MLKNFKRIVRGVTMGLSATERRKQIVNIMKSIERKNKYSQSQYYRYRIDRGYGDCSSTVQWAYKLGANINPGSYTVAQILAVNGKDVDFATTKRYIPRERKLQPGDLIFFKGGNPNRPYQVGHVEMYIGDGKLMGHGYGIGPTVKDMKAYCRARHKKGKGYIKARRWIEHDILEKPSKKLIGRLQIALNTAGYKDKNKKQLIVDWQAGPLTLSACPTLRKGKNGVVVSIMQEGLIAMGYGVGVAGADGYYGALTVQGVKEFQKANHITVNGIFGKESWRKWFGW